MPPSAEQLGFATHIPADPATVHDLHIVVSHCWSQQTPSAVEHTPVAHWSVAVQDAPGDSFTWQWWLASQ